MPEQKTTLKIETLKLEFASTETTPAHEVKRKVFQALRDAGIPFREVTAHPWQEAWFAVIQNENSCTPTGKPCSRTRCGCKAEQETLLDDWLSPPLPF
jgi:hypothetical protein